MNPPSLNLSRRKTFAGVGAGLLAIAASGQAMAAVPDPASAEAANIRIVDQFCAAWGAPNVDPAKLAATYLTDDCIVRFMDSQMMAAGKITTIEIFKSFLAGGLRYDLKVLNSVAVGPIVANARIDTTFAPGQPPAPANIAGVFILHSGKIKEWSDYFMLKG